MKRVLLIPAAGAGTRLGAALPKALVEVNGRSMLEHLLDLYAPLMDAFMIVVSPAAEAQVRARLASRQERIVIAVQQTPTGMLDAILIPQQQLQAWRPLQLWITWCDQIAVRPATVARLLEAAQQAPDAALVLPTLAGAEPYIHFERDAGGRIVRVLHRREGDSMPVHGESDMGLFVLSDSAYFELLPRYAAEVEPGGSTGERNFLPFIAWVGRHGGVRSISGTHPMEAVGINTPEQLEQVSGWLQHE